MQGGGGVTVQKHAPWESFLKSHGSFSPLHSENAGSLKLPTAGAPVLNAGQREKNREKFLSKLTPQDLLLKLLIISPVHSCEINNYN